MKRLIAANWKMNKAHGEAISFIKELKKSVGGKKADVVICPAFTLLRDVANEIKGTNIKLGAQNMHFEDSGAFTGEISAKMLKDAGCEYVILGHSERREFFNETDDIINKKVGAALKNGLRPILCVGETLEQRQRSKTEDVIENQLIKCLREIKGSNRVIIAYEPVWAISRGNAAIMPATPGDAELTHIFIRKVMDAITGDASRTMILYGGSVKPGNANGFFEKKNINGALVGNASLDAKSFAEIVEAAK